MRKIVCNSEYFNIKDTLECGQIFRFKPFKKGFLVLSLGKCAYCYQENDQTVIECDSCDEEYFYNYFDLGRDYSAIYKEAASFNVDVLTVSASAGKGIRILNQNKKETLSETGTLLVIVGLTKPGTPKGEIPQGSLSI